MSNVFFLGCISFPRHSFRLSTLQPKRKAPMKNPLLILKKSAWRIVCNVQMDEWMNEFYMYVKIKTKPEKENHKKWCTTEKLKHSMRVRSIVVVWCVNYVCKIIVAKVRNLFYIPPLLALLLIVCIFVLLRQYCRFAMYTWTQIYSYLAW